jgi:hypothetical protein
MQSVSPVFTDEEVQFEREIAKNQPQYSSVIGLPVTLRIVDQNNPTQFKDVPDWGIAIRFRLSPEERAQVAAGLDLVVTQLTFGKQLSPMNFQFCPAKTKPVFDMCDKPPAALAQGDGDPSSADLDEFEEARKKMELARLHTTGLADICPSCGETDKTAASHCANHWHQEGVKKIATEPAEDQPELGV